MEYSVSQLGVLDQDQKTGLKTNVGDKTNNFLESFGTIDQGFYKKLEQALSIKGLVIDLDKLFFKQNKEGKLIFDKKKCELLTAIVKSFLQSEFLSKDEFDELLYINNQSEHGQLLLFSDGIHQDFFNSYEDIKIIAELYKSYSHFFDNPDLFHDSKIFLGKHVSEKLYNCLLEVDNVQSMPSFTDSYAKLESIYLNSSGDLYDLMQSRFDAAKRRNEILDSINNRIVNEYESSIDSDFVFDQDSVVESKAFTLNTTSIIKLINIAQENNLSVGWLKKLIYTKDGQLKSDKELVSIFSLLKDFFINVGFVSNNFLIDYETTSIKLLEVDQKSNDLIAKHLDALKLYKEKITFWRDEKLNTIIQQIGQKVIKRQGYDHEQNQALLIQEVANILLTPGYYLGVKDFKNLHDQYTIHKDTYSSPQLLESNTHNTFDQAKEFIDKNYNLGLLEKWGKLDSFEDLDVNNGLLKVFEYYQAQEQQLGGSIIPVTINSLVEKDGEYIPLEVQVLKNYTTEYPRQIVDALGELYKEYNHAFMPLIVKNRESEGDYQYAFDKEKNPVNHFVQIDMTALPKGFLLAVQEGRFTQHQIVQILRHRIFEIENSLAMYHLLQSIFKDDSLFSSFDIKFRHGLDLIRQKHGRPIALLAVTEDKYNAMKTSEFGKKPDETLNPEEVQLHTGFDNFFGPESFKKMIEEHGGECPYILYSRTSMPLSTLKNPTQKPSTILDDPQLRSIIKKNSITFNIDDPNMGDDFKVNDTKEYMKTMGMIYPINSTDDIFSKDFVVYLKKGGKYSNYSGNTLLSEEFTLFLSNQGLNLDDVVNGKIGFRLKPMRESYGCYGHINSLHLNNTDEMKKLLQELKNRGTYCLQIEMPQTHMVSQVNQEKYMTIDRNFFFIDPETGDPLFLGGFRSSMPLNTTEAKKGRVHGNEQTLWSEIH